MRTAGGGLVCAVVALALVGSTLWLTVAGLAAAVLGTALGIAALVRSGGTAPRRLVVAGGVVAILLGGLSLLTGGARLALWPVAEAYERCVSRTLTLSGTARCQQQLEDGIWSYFSGGPGSAGAFPATTGAVPRDAASPDASTSNASTDPGTAASPSPASRASAA
jgi:hypothetical protein